jgi:hypothetical protein
MADAGLGGFLTKRLKDRTILDWGWDGFGRMIDGRMIDGRMIDGRMIDGRMIDGRMIDGRMIFWGWVVGGPEMDGRRGAWGIFDKTIEGQNHV